MINNNIKGLSCKFIEDKYLICGIIVGAKLYISSFQINNILSIGILLSDDLSEYLIFDSISSLCLYIIDINNIKLLCLQSNQHIRCNFLNITKNEKSSYELIGDENIVFNISNTFIEKNCYFSEFDNQYLFCCEITNFIKFLILIKIFIIKILFIYIIFVSPNVKANLVYY